MRAVRDYLRDAGMCDPIALDRESRRIAALAVEQRPVCDEGDTTLVETALRLAVRELAGWIGTTKTIVAETSSTTDEVVVAQLPDLMAQYSGPIQNSATVRLNNRINDAVCPVVPRSRLGRMQQQALSLMPGWLIALLGMTALTPRLPPEHTRHFHASWTLCRISLLFLTSTGTAVGTWHFHGDITHYAGLLTWPLTLLFAILFGWVTFSFWVATFGFISLLCRGRSPSAPSECGLTAPLPVTALVMPIYNEDPPEVFANLRAVAESLRTTGLQSRFHLFALSDTTDPAIRLEEEQIWAELTSRLGAEPRLFYRHRRENVGRKAGNIAEFCSRWGAEYKYMAVLDADSVMSGPTLVEMVRRMERDPALGILQAPPLPVNRQSFFGRLQQFASQAYGSVFLEGFALWSQCDGNYWGHNAVIRVQPFMKHCDLPVLPGDGPLGGEILSHDFVEAALMRRAGWKVCLAHDLTGSYEECPATILAFAQRDQRWCQGNLQHVRLLLADGFHAASRVHLGMGAMSYLSSPLWCAFLLLSLTSAFFSGAIPDRGPSGGLVLFLVSVGLLLLPKLWGVIALRVRVAPHEMQTTWRRVGTGVLLEILMSALVAPVMMLFHTRFVVSTLLGKKVVWNAQQRGDGRVLFKEAAVVHGGHTLVGLAIGIGGYLWAPTLLPWLLPIVLGLIVAIPLSMLLGSVRVGRALARHGLLLIPEETAPPDVIQRQHAARAEMEMVDELPPGEDSLTATLIDPARFHLHVGIVQATGCAAALPDEERRRIRTAGTVPPRWQRAVLDDIHLLESLHVAARIRYSSSPA